MQRFLHPPIFFLTPTRPLFWSTIPFSPFFQSARRPFIVPAWVRWAPAPSPSSRAPVLQPLLSSSCLRPSQSFSLLILNLRLGAKANVKTWSDETLVAGWLRKKKSKVRLLSHFLLVFLIVASRVVPTRSTGSFFSHRASTTTTRPRRSATRELSILPPVRFSAFSFPVLLHSFNSPSLFVSQSLVVKITTEDDEKIVMEMKAGQLQTVITLKADGAEERDKWANLLKANVRLLSSLISPSSFASTFLSSLVIILLNPILVW